MKLKLTKLPTESVRGIYTINGVKNCMPERACFLAPDAADSFLTHLSNFVTVSDVLRTAESSLAAVKAGRGAQMPSFSSHNYGIAIDIDTEATRKAIGLKTKAELDEWMSLRGWFCFRVDHASGHEDWHFTYLSSQAVISPNVHSTAGYIEAEILKRYGDQMKLNAVQVQTALAKLKMYGGALDGKIGPLSKAAISAFQRAWSLAEDGDYIMDPNGKADIATQRTLAFVAADIEVV